MTSAAPCRSMTSSGSHVAQDAAGRLEIDLRSVNHRFRKLSVRVMGALPRIDHLVDKALKGTIARGAVTAHVRWTPTADQGLAGIDAARFRAAAAHLRTLAQEADLVAPTVGDVLRLPAFGSSATPADDAEQDALIERVTAALRAAAAALQASREREGEALRTEILRLLDAMGEQLQGIAAHADQVPPLAQERLRARIDTLLQGSGITADDAQLARECAHAAERADIREELARIEAHLGHARELLGAGGVMGKNLDFLAQELHREANTIGSKSHDLQITRVVMALKADIERMREQVQNIE